MTQGDNASLLEHLDPRIAPAPSLQMSTTLHTENISYMELVEAYHEQIRGLADGGADILLAETSFDTLNLKAAIFAMEKFFEEAGRRLPVMLSVTITDQSGRTLSGQTVEAFWHSIRHAQPLSVGINCALGASEMRPYMEALSEIADCHLSCYPNAGLPNPLSDTGYDETPEITSRLLEDYAQSGFLNIVGGCRGTTPDHIAAIAEATKDLPPRNQPAQILRLDLAAWSRSQFNRSQKTQPRIYSCRRTY